MFCEATVEYRSGIIVSIGETEHYYSLKYFMNNFVQYVKSHAEKTQKFDRTFAPIEIDSIEKLFRASQSITVDTEVTSQDAKDKKEFIWKFLINGRIISCRDQADCYVYDEELIKQYPQDFNKNRISYLDMARFLSKQMDKLGIDDATLATKIIKMLYGEKQDFTDLEVVPVMVAILFISEPKRNPSCFIPSLILLDLIRHKATDFLGERYTFVNGLQNPVIVVQRDESDRDMLRDVVYPSLMRTPSIIALMENIKITLEGCESQAGHVPLPTQPSKKIFLNCEKKYQGKNGQNQKTLSASKELVQTGGYFPNTHQFSYTELKEKRQNGQTTLSDQKSFAIISDWLFFKNFATPMHYYEVSKKLYNQSKSHIDQFSLGLTMVVFPQLFNSINRFFNTSFLVQPLLLYGDNEDDAVYLTWAADMVKTNSKGCLPPPNSKVNEKGITVCIENLGGVTQGVNRYFSPNRFGIRGQ
ncbi:MAG: hypothetical protein ABSA84_03360 [Gammaproteobacteria bacterium]|jgi:hypothetical protein